MKLRNEYLAAIDLGTNSFHIIVVKIRENGTFEPVARQKESIRLGSSFSATEHISEDAMRRGLDCLARFKTLAQTYKAQIRAVATSALREAKNREDFIDRAENELGIHIDVVSGYEEARLIYFGVLQGLPIFDKRILLIDIGGGSTEILVGEKGEVLFSKSFKLGAVRLTEKFFRSETITNSQLHKCRLFIQEMLSPFKNVIQNLQPEITIASSGTAQSLAQMISVQGPGRDTEILNGFSFTYNEFKKIRNQILEADSVKKRSKLEGLEAKRADIIVGGTLILEQILQSIGVDTVKISDFALREGIIIDTIKKWEHFQDPAQSRGFDDIRAKSVQNLVRSFCKDEKHSSHVCFLALRIFDQLQELHRCSPEERELLEAAALLHEIGLSISHSAYHKHSYYIIRNSESMLGFTFSEIEIIAQVARYHRKSLPKSKHREFAQLHSAEKECIRKLAAFLRIATALDRNMQNSIEDVICKSSKDKVLFQLVTKDTYEPNLELWSAEEQKDLFEQVYQKKAQFGAFTPAMPPLL